jgi:uncharacterized membrane protein
MDEAGGQSPVWARPYDLYLLAILALLGVASALLLPDGNPVRAIITIPLLIFLPGYALTSVLWPESRASGSGIGDIERIAIGIGLSIVIVSVAGLFLSFASSFNLASLLAGILAPTLAFAALAHLRWNRMPQDRRYNIEFLSRAEIFSGPWEKALGAAAVAGIVICSGLVTYAAVAPHVSPPSTEFYLMDANMTAQTYTINMSANDTAKVFVGISCHEKTMVNYTIVASLEGANDTAFVSDWNGTMALSRQTALARNLTLEDGESFTDGFTFSLPGPGSYRIIWCLQMEGANTAYEVNCRVEVH